MPATVTGGPLKSPCRKTWPTIAVIDSPGQKRLASDSLMISDRNRLGFAEESAGAQRGAAGGKIARRDAADQSHRPLQGNGGRIGVRDVKDRLASDGSAGIHREASDGARGLNARQHLNALSQFTKEDDAARAGSIARIEEAEIHREDTLDGVAAVGAHDVDEAVQ